MDNKTFENYQKRMLDAMSKLNKHNDDPFTKLCKILENLKNFVNNGTFSSNRFKQEVEKQFIAVGSSDEMFNHFKKTLIDFCSTKGESLKTISELESMVKPISLEVGSWSSVAGIAREFMAEIEKSI